MQEAVRRHDAILRTTITEHGGHVFKTVGDAFCSAFTCPGDAIAAMLAVRQTLAAEDFSAVDELLVRAAIHTGAADERDGDYFGPALNRIARLLAIGHGGQILLSNVARDLARDDLPEGAAFVDLGAHRLRDLAEPERVWQLDLAGFPDEFPPLRSLDASPNNLPLPPTSFVGREDDLVEVNELLGHHRLLTVLGSGGVGKTRLAIAAGAALLERYPDGVWFADLSPITDPALVASIVAQALGMSQQRGRRVDEAIPQWLRRKKLLLILDNCEHVVETVAALASSIIRGTVDVRILATSRQVLDITSEVVHRLPSLSIPDAVRLFVDRARAADTRFALTVEAATIVAEICRRLDGIALAIELAAARVKVLSIPSLAQRLNERFKLLTGGSRDVLPRQKTLTALIDWSYDLLTPQEQLLFNRLGVFSGGFGTDAATAVCAGADLDEFDIFDLLASLTDKSLVAVNADGAQERYRLLESTAAYALGKLAASDERESTVRRHAEYFREQAHAADERYGSGPTVAWLAGVELDLDNFRAALEWALKQDNDAVLGGAIAGALAALWFYAGLAVEGRYWIELALSRISEDAHPAIAARAHLAVSTLSPGKRALEAAELAEQLYESVGDRRGAARAQRGRGWALHQLGHRDEASATIARALVALRACGDASGVATCQRELGSIERERGNLHGGRELFAQSLVGLKAVGHELATAAVLGSMAELEFAADDPVQALRLASEALELYLRGKNATNIATIYNNIAAYRIALGDLKEARESAREGLRLARQVQSESSLAWALQHLALLAALSGDPRRGAQLLGYVNAQFDHLGMQKRESTERWSYDKLLAALRESLSDDEIKKLADVGAQFSEDRVVAEALAQA